MTAIITILNLPNDNGFEITDLLYSINGGTPVSLGTTATGIYEVPATADDVVQLLAENVNGVGAASDFKSLPPFSLKLVNGDLILTNSYVATFDGTTLSAAEAGGATTYTIQMLGSGGNVVDETPVSASGDKNLGAVSTLFSGVTTPGNYTFRAFTPDVGTYAVPFTPPEDLFAGETNGGYWKASAGVTLNGSDVSNLADQSGFSRPVAQATASRQPAFLSSPDRMDFNGTSDFLSRADACGFTGSPEITFIGIYSAINSASTTLLTIGDASAQFGEVLKFFIDDVATGVLSVRFNDGNVISNAAGVDLTAAPSVLIYNKPAGGNASNTTFRINGGAVLGTASGTGSSTDPLNLRNEVTQIGASPDVNNGGAPSSFSDMVLREAILLPKTLNSSEWSEFGAWIQDEHPDVPWSAVT